MAHQTLSSMGKGDSKTCQQKREKVLASQGQEGRGLGREPRLINTGEENVSPHSALGPQLQITVQALGWGCRDRL